MSYLEQPQNSLTRLELTLHTSDSGARSLTVSFLIRREQLLLEDFDAAAHDAVLRTAHEAGHMPVGPILVRTEEATYDPPKLKEGIAMSRSIDDLAIDNQLMQGNLVRVVGSMDLGLSLS